MTCFSSDEISGTKNAFFFLKRAPTHHSSFLFAIPSKITIIEKPHIVLFPELWFLGCITRVLKFNDALECVRWGSPKSGLVINFLNPENWSFEKVSIKTFYLIFDIPILVTHFYNFNTGIFDKAATAPFFAAKDHQAKLLALSLSAAYFNSEHITCFHLKYFRCI